ncbi:hypothetical protein FFK22_040905 [Mycobacterium sp. KBS0706]|uniref:hypothetical protein n=1 Tax=Mycobacterium sp. KBS0706 TaxID=2578109 RepID=UPI00110FBAF8|nr:hypothetical protein [Mycobacterium sp. KBS0706]TSD82858.1 hypothetical protein FFK22_040905 [Mycobacterium sp. KBS0706]
MTLVPCLAADRGEKDIDAEHQPSPTVMSDEPMSDRVARAALFFAAFVGMALEIVAARRYAPAIGSGIDAWAAVIATALGGFALGHVLSGWLMTGRWPTERIVTRGLFAIATIVSVETVFVPQLLSGPAGIRAPLGYPLMVAFHGLASIATGMVGPAAARIVIAGGKGTACGEVRSQRRYPGRLDRLVPRGEAGHGLSGSNEGLSGTMAFPECSVDPGRPLAAFPLATRTYLFRRPTDVVWLMDAAPSTISPANRARSSLSEDF